MTLLNNSSVVYWDLLEGWKYRRIRRAAIDGGCCVTALDRKEGSLELTCHCRVHQSDWLHQWQITRLIIEGRWCLPKLRTSQFTLQNLFISCRTITIRNFIQWIWHWTKWWPRSEHGRRKKRKMMMATRCDLCDSWSMGHDDDFHHSAPGGGLISLISHYCTEMPNHCCCWSLANWFPVDTALSTRLYVSEHWHSLLKESDVKRNLPWHVSQLIHYLLWEPAGSIEMDKSHSSIECISRRSDHN